MRRHFFIVAGIVFMTSVAVAAPLSDTTGNKNQTAIEFLLSHGMVDGYGDGTFKPDNSINRAELLKILIKSVGMAPSVQEYHDCFSDVKKEWFAPFICYAKEKKWVQGYADGSFHPSRTVNTAEALKMLVNVYGYQPMQTSSAMPFKDIDLSAWYAPYVLVARNAGILDMDTGNLGIAAHMTRGRISGMIYRAVVARETANNHTAAPDTPTVLQKFYNKLRRGGGGSGQPSASVISSSTASSQVTLSSPTITFNDLTKNYGDSSFTLSPSSNSVGAFTFMSSNTSVATVSANTVTIVAAGTTIITATQAANGNYTSGNATATLTVNAIAPTIGTFSNINKQMGDIPFNLSAPASNSAGAFTFTSGSTGVATVAGNTVTLVSNGTSIITATQAANGNYTSGIKTMTLTVFQGQCQLEEPCLNGGSCTNGPGGSYSCSCSGMYSGDICELYDAGCNYDHGAIQGCVNHGVCVPDVLGGYCQCPANFCGTYCENPDMDSNPTDGFCV